MQSIDADSSFDYKNVKISFVVSGGEDYPTKYIPNVKGLDRAAAQAILWKFGITVERMTIEKSEEPENTVIAQSPASNGTIPEDCKTVKLTLSGGTDYSPSWIVVKVPQVYGQTLDQAMITLTNSYCAVGNIIYVSSETVPAGTIIEQSREPGSLCSGYPYEVYVDIIISLGNVPPEEPDDTTADDPTVTPPEDTSSPSETTPIQ